MLTEVMSLMLLNKNEAAEKFATLNKVDPSAKLPTPSMLRSRRHRERKQRSDKLEPFEQDSLLERPRSEKMATKEQEWDQKQIKRAKKKTFEERLQEYEAR